MTRYKKDSFLKQKKTWSSAFYLCLKIFLREKYLGRKRICPKQIFCYAIFHTHSTIPFSKAWVVSVIVIVVVVICKSKVNS